MREEKLIALLIEAKHQRDQVIPDWEYFDEGMRKLVAEFMEPGRPAKFFCLSCNQYRDTCNGC